ncbi:MAG TPA: LemA family protein [Synechococcales cyanobacterium M55_K2018_004]|nr:LemA family protein [Synechococcales cyanobacterium M55_K2018_004]
MIILGVITLLVVYLLIYNSLVGKKNQVEQAFSSIDVLLKKRCDLIPNLVATVKNYMQFEQKTLVEVTRLRSRAIQAQGDTRIDLENQISRAIGNIMVAVEAYPELKANQNFITLQESLNEIEEQISAARRFYNSAVTDYNNAVEMFPTNLVASQMNYRLRRLFEATEQDRRNVDVGSLFNS